MRSPGLCWRGPAYDPKVVTIWDGFFRPGCRGHLDFDYVLYSNTSAQVTDWSRRGDVAWEIAAEPGCATAARRRGRRPLTPVTMRDNAANLRSVIVVRPTRRHVARRHRREGSWPPGAVVDSPQARSMPLSVCCESAGLARG